MKNILVSYPVISSFIINLVYFIVILLVIKTSKSNILEDGKIGIIIPLIFLLGFVLYNIVKNSINYKVYVGLIIFLMYFLNIVVIIVKSKVITILLNILKK